MENSTAGRATLQLQLIFLQVNKDMVLLYKPCMCELLHVCTSSDFRAVYSQLENCSVHTNQHLIRGECSYPVVSLATGFQIIAQLGVLDQVHKLYISQTLANHASASVEVGESGEYLVSIIPIRGNTGITGSDVEYREMVMVDVLTTTSGDMFTTAGMYNNSFYVQLTGL